MKAMAEFMSVFGNTSKRNEIIVKRCRPVLLALSMQAAFKGKAVGKSPEEKPVTVTVSCIDSPKGWIRSNSTASTIEKRLGFQGLNQLGAVRIPQHFVALSTLAVRSSVYYLAVQVANVLVEALIPPASNGNILAKVMSTNSVLQRIGIQLGTVRTHVRHKVWSPLKCRYSHCQRLLKGLVVQVYNMFNREDKWSLLSVDVKIKIIEMLSPFDIAKLACVNKEMSVLCTDVRLWRRKFNEVFGNVNIGRPSDVPDGWSVTVCGCFRSSLVVISACESQSCDNNEGYLNGSRFRFRLNL